MENLDAMNLLDKSIDDIEDLPGFAVPPEGNYTLKMNCAVKAVNDKPMIETTYEVVSVNELNNPEEADSPAAKVGTKFSTLSMIGNDIAMGKFKETVAPIAEHFGEKNVGKLVTEVIKDLVIAGTVKHRKNKEDPDKPYGEVKNIVVA